MAYHNQELGKCRQGDKPMFVHTQTTTPSERCASSVFRLLKFITISKNGGYQSPFFVNSKMPGRIGMPYFPEQV